MEPRALVCHPDTPCPRVSGIAVAPARTAGGGLSLRYTLEGDLPRLKIPQTRPARHVDGLWRHTCFEVFVMAADAPAYREFNIAPSGEWAAYAFRGYREAGPPEPSPTPEIRCRAQAGHLVVEAVLAAAALPACARLRLGLCAVIETDDGGLSYWALRHPPGRPDFHHTDGFVLELAGT